MRPKLPDGKGSARRDMPSRHRVTLRAIAVRHGLSEQEMLTRTRSWAASRARAEFYQIVREGENPPSLPAIASWFGFNHTSVIKGLQARERMMS